VTPRREQTGRRDAARRIAVEHGAYAADANGKRLQPPPRYGQNDRSIAIGRKNWTFAGSDAGGDRAAAIYTLIETCKMNDVDPQAWLADVLARLPDHPAHRLDELLPWNWIPRASAIPAQAA
jgi:IS66 C-terminal element